MDIAILSERKSWLAPLAGYTDQAFRIVCKSFGADVLVSEMVSADGLIRDSIRTVRFIHFDDSQRPYAVQIFGHDPLTMARAAEICIPFQPDLIDINMGCPVRKVVKRGAGSALMTDPARAASIVKEVKTALNGRIPLSVKFRSGWDSQSLNYLDFGLKLQDAGADLVCLHPRTAKQMFGGKSNWEHIAELKKSLNIPVIGNGDIDSPEAAARMYASTGCDSIMIGRGALGRPWLFRQIHQLKESGTYIPITRGQILSAALYHLETALRFKREPVVVKEMRSQLTPYTHGLIGAPELRRKINQAISADDLKNLLISSPCFKV
jgi:tRNA-dihydrouridine synthase B